MLNKKRYIRLIKFKRLYLIKSIIFEINGDIL